MALPRLHLVTDDALLADPTFSSRAWAALAAGGGETALHLRGPGTPGGPLHRLALELVRVAAEEGAILVVNDRVDVALLAGAEGVHLGARSLPAPVARTLLPDGARIGVSTHAPEEVARAERDGADWAFVGTIYPTPSHPGRAGMGPGGLRRCVEARDTLPLLAIGGVRPDRVPELLEAGARGVAVMRGVWDAPDPAAAVNQYLQALQGA